MAMKQTDPAGFDVIREHYRQISSTVDPTILAGCMFEANLIEFDLLNDSGREDRSPASRVQALINALLGNGDEGVFQNFVQKLCEEKLWQELGGTLRGRVGHTPGGCAYVYVTSHSSPLLDAYVKKGGQWKEDEKGQGARAGGGGGGGAKPLEQSGTYFSRAPRPAAAGFVETSCALHYNHGCIVDITPMTRYLPPSPPSISSLLLPPLQVSPGWSPRSPHPPPLRATPTSDPCQWCTLEQIFSHGCHAPTKGETPLGKRGNQCKSSTPHWVGGADMAGITQGFGSLKTALRECVEKMTSVEGLKAAVRGISGAPLHNVAMYGDHAHTIQRCSTHAEVLEVVNMYASWAGHEVMPHLLQSVGGEARRERETFNAELQGFRKRLTEYRRLRLWECPPLVTGHTLPSGGRYLLVKPVGQADPTLFALEQFHQRLVKSLNLPLYALRMCTVCAACGGVVYCVPRGVYREVFKVPLSLEQMREASVVNIVELTSVGGDPVSACVSVCVCVCVCACVCACVCRCFCV